MEARQTSKRQNRTPTFTNTLKVELFSKLRMAFEKRSVRIPISRAVREDLHRVNRVTTPTGGITYRAPHSADGHSDRCTALALALRAWRQASHLRRNLPLP